MKEVLRVVFSVFVLCLSLAALGFDRDHRALRAFRLDNPCPTTGQVKGACPGWVVDHIVPLCAGGADKPINMQWQAKAIAKEKDADELRLCRWIREAYEQRETKNPAWSGSGGVMAEHRPTARTD